MSNFGDRNLRNDAPAAADGRCGTGKCPGCISHCMRADHLVPTSGDALLWKSFFWHVGAGRMTDMS